MTSNNQDIEALIPTEKSCFNNSTTATVLAAIVSTFNAGLDNDSKKFNLTNKKELIIIILDLLSMTNYSGVTELKLLIYIE